ncbi:hypothetical protein [Tautonia marina]|nr:hypothetical protein [Tautonia marina]
MSWFDPFYDTMHDRGNASPRRVPRFADRRSEGASRPNELYGTVCPA